MKEKERDALVKAIQEQLNTHDKRYMFLKIYFPDILPFINIEGSPKETSWNIYTHFKKTNMRGSLIACMNSTFNTDLTLTHLK